MTTLLDRAAAMGLHVMIGAIDGGNEPSLAFHRALGFQEVAHMPQVGIRHGRRLDLVFMQRIVERAPRGQA